MTKQTRTEKSSKSSAKNSIKQAKLNFKTEKEQAEQTSKLDKSKAIKKEDTKPQEKTELQKNLTSSFQSLKLDINTRIVDIYKTLKETIGNAEKKFV